MTEFYNTVGGQRFFAKLEDSLQKIAESLTKMADAQVKSAEGNGVAGVYVGWMIYRDF